MDLDQAISKHAEWKMKFRTAMARNEALDAETISKDHCCDLGKWLHGDGKVQHSNLSAFPKLVERHAAFHVEAGKVAQLINEKRHDDAEACFGMDAPYSVASREVGVAVIALKREAGL